MQSFIRSTVFSRSCCKSLNKSFSSLTDKEIIQQLMTGQLSHHKLEKVTNDPVRAVNLRREYVHATNKQDDKEFMIPMREIDPEAFYSQIIGANCESVIGYIPIPIGVAGPCLVDGKSYQIPMATTEGALLASTNRGCRAVTASGGITTVLLRDGMTRAPCLQCKDLKHANEVKLWIESPEGFKTLQESFAKTSRFGRVQSIRVTIAGRYVHLRIRCFTGDAMGMNMIGKGSNEVVHTILEHHPHAKLMTLSGNMCTDKKPTAINWIEGRGKSVAAEAVIHRDIVKKILKTEVDAVVQTNIAKNYIGSAMAGAQGGFNAHSANMVTAVFLATGQDPAQNVESSNCITIIEKTDEGDLRISVTMPCIEVGTVGGGTTLPAQKSALKMLGVAGAHPTQPGSNAIQLAKIVASTVLCGELSLMAALSANHLVSAHLELNRRPAGK